MIHSICSYRSYYAALQLMLLLCSLNSAYGASGIDLKTCTPKESNFYIQIMDMGETPAEERIQAAFQKAAERWQAVIVGDLQGQSKKTVNDWFGGVFKNKKYNGAVDDVVIGYEIIPMDGKGGQLGQAGAVFKRNSGPHKGSTISGVMQFDSQDFETMTDNDVTITILHEMGHVLGLVGVGEASCSSGCNPENSSKNTPYQCQLAIGEYEVLNPGKTLLLENNGGRGTACSHWEENSFNLRESSELMTGTFEANLYQPISLVTVAALDDIPGYEVDYCGADIWPADATTSTRFPVTKTDNDITGIIDSIIPQNIEDFVKDLWNTILDWVTENQLYAIIIGSALVLLILSCCCFSRNRRSRRENNKRRSKQNDDNGGRRRHKRRRNRKDDYADYRV